MKNKQSILHLLSKALVVWVSMSLLIGQVGCAPKYQIPSEDLRSKFGTIGIVFINDIPESNFTTFAKGRLAGGFKGVAGGAAAGADVGLQVALTPGEPAIGILLLPFLVAGGAVIGAVVGGVAGTAKAVPASESEKIETAISNVLSALRIQESMSEHVLKASTELVDYRFYPVSIPTEKKNEYGFLKERGIDTVMEVDVERVGFEGGKGADPAIAFFMNLRERLVRTSDNAVLYERTFKYRSAKRKFSCWAEDNARLLSDEFERAYQCLAEKVVDETFLRYDLLKSKWPVN